MARTTGRTDTPQEPPMQRISTTTTVLLDPGVQVSATQPARGLAVVVLTDPMNPSTALAVSSRSPEALRAVAQAFLEAANLAERTA